MLNNGLYATGQPPQCEKTTQQV